MITSFSLCTFSRVISGATVEINIRYPDGTFIKKPVRLRGVKVPVAIHKYTGTYEKSENEVAGIFIKQYFSDYGPLVTVSSVILDMFGRWLGIIKGPGFAPSLNTLMINDRYKSDYWGTGNQIFIKNDWYGGIPVITEEGITLNPWHTWGKPVFESYLSRSINRSM